MVHKIRKPEKKLVMAYRVYVEYPFMKGKWFPMVEQRQFLEDAQNDLWMYQRSPFYKRMGINMKIVHEPAEAMEMFERRLLSKLGLKKHSKIRGTLESLMAYW